MANFVIADRVKDTVSSFTSTTTVNLTNSAPTGFQTFGAAVGDANVCVYCMTDSSGNWEISYGAYTASGTKLARAATPLASSNSGAQATFSGTISIFLTDAALAVGGLPPATFPGTNIATNFNGGSATATAGSSTGVVRYIPVYIRQWFSSFTIYANISSLAAGTATFALGLYDTGPAGGPNKRLGQTTGLICGNQGGGATGSNNSGSIALSTASFSPKPPGLYWVGHVVATTTATWVTGGVTSASVNNSMLHDVVGIVDITTANAVQTCLTETSATLPSTASASATPSTGQAPLVGVAAVL